MLPAQPYRLQLTLELVQDGIVRYIGLVLFPIDTNKFGSRK